MLRINLLIPLMAVLTINSLWSEEGYDSLIERARKGEAGAVLPKIERFYLQKGTKTVFEDLIAVSVWAGEDSKAVKLYEGSKLDLGDFALEMVAKAYRNLGSFDKAAQIYRECFTKNGSNYECYAGYILSLADMGEAKRGLEFVESLKNSIGFCRYAFLKGYAYENLKRFYDAFIWYQRAYACSDRNEDAIKGYVRVLNILGLPSLALEIAQKEGISNEEICVYRENRAAFFVRWGELYVKDPSKRFQDTDKALKMLRRIELECPYPEVKKRAKFDEIVALRDRFEMERAVERFERIGNGAPYYVLNAAADAYLYLQKPEKALVLYEESLKKRPDYLESKLGKFYALSEAFEIDRAIEWIERVDNKEPPFLPDGYENEYKIQTAIARAQGYYFGDYLQKSQEILESLWEKAPANTDIAAELASLYRARGWPVKSLRLARFALGYEDDHKGLKTASFYSNMDRYSFKEAKDLKESLKSSFPYDLAVKRIERIYSIYEDRRELLVEARLGKSGSPEIGSRYGYLKSELYTEPIRYNYRLFLESFYSYANLQEGKEIFKTIGAGAEYKKDGLIFKTGVRTTKNPALGAVFADLRYDVSDYLKSEASYESFSIKTPLRALINGVRADRKSIGFEWYESESASTAFSYDRMEFTDGNLRQGFTLNRYERLITGPYYKLNLYANFYFGRNDFERALYFNPKSELYFGAELENVWELYRRYSRAFSHSLAITVGRYRQKGFGEDETIDYGFSTPWAIRYEHRYESGYDFYLTYGIARGRNYYDGAGEFDTSFYVSLDWRF